MKLTQSLRWRMQFWYGILLAAALTGFGVMAYRQQKSSDLDRIDHALERETTLMLEGLRDHLRGPRRGAASTRPGSPAQRGRALREFLDSEDTKALLANNSLEADYFVMWDRDGSELGSLAAPRETVPLPESDEEGGTLNQLRIREDLREAYRFRAPGDCLLLGKSMEPERQQWRRLAWQLAISGLGILALGLVGGWFFLSRAIRPIQAISQSAREYAGGKLDTRIPHENGGGELGQLTEDLNETFEQLEKAFARQGRFTSDAAHELRTPVSVILSQTQAALMRDREPEAYRDALASCERAANRLRKLIDSLLTLTSLDAKSPDVPNETVDLASITEDCAELMKPLVEKRQLTLKKQLDPAPCLGDADQLNQVLTNLIANAINYSDQSSSISISTGRSDDVVWAKVADEGKGIAPEHLPHLFERFYRADSARTRDAGGAGLGLAICDEIIEAHGGKIDVESEIGVGTTFTIKIPVGR